MIFRAFRRHSRLAVALAALVAGGAMLAPASQAAAPMAKISTGGFYRMMLGDFEITALNDGTTELPVDKLLQGATPEQIAKALAKQHLKAPLETSFNGFLINTGDKLVLVDSGAGGLFGANLGRLVANLKASGYQPDQIDEIYITHMHFDHVGGLAANNERIFPNAVVRAEKRESDFWLDPANEAKAPEDRKGFFQGARASLAPYVAAGKFKPFEGATVLISGVSAQPSIGHTPGHTSYLVESKGEKLLLIGDLIHVGAVQFPMPKVFMAFDNDGKAAQAERLKTFAEAAKDGVLIGAAHISFPGLGRLQPHDKGYVWVPPNFTQFH